MISAAFIRRPRLAVVIAILITLAGGLAMLRIPVDMHNVPGEQVFRPSSWSRFGAMDLQGADYRACATYGPLYR